MKTLVVGALVVAFLAPVVLRADEVGRPEEVVEAELDKGFETDAARQLKADDSYAEKQYQNEIQKGDKIQRKVEQLKKQNDDYSQVVNKKMKRLHEVEKTVKRDQRTLDRLTAKNNALKERVAHLNEQIAKINLKNHEVRVQTAQVQANQLRIQKRFEAMMKRREAARVSLKISRERLQKVRHHHNQGVRMTPST